MYIYINGTKLIYELEMINLTVVFPLHVTLRTNISQDYRMEMIEHGY